MLLTLLLEPLDSPKRGLNLEFSEVANATAMSGPATQLTTYFDIDTINAWKLGLYWSGFVFALLCDNIHKVVPLAQNQR